MEAERLGSLGFFLAFFCVLVASFCEGNHRIAYGASYGNGVRWTAHNIDKHTADQVSILCRKQLEQITQAIEYFTLTLPDVTNYNTKSDVASLRKMLVRKAIMGPHPKVKQSHVRCLKSKKSSFHDPNKERRQRFLPRPYGSNSRTLERRYCMRRCRGLRARPLRPLGLDQFRLNRVELVGVSPAPSSVRVLLPDPYQIPDDSPPPIPIPNRPPSPTLPPNGTSSPILTPFNGPLFPIPTPNGTPSPILTPPNGPPSPIPTSPNRPLFPVPTPNGTPSPILNPPNRPPPIPSPPYGPLFPIPTPNRTPSPIPTPLNGPPSPIPTPLNGPPSPIPIPPNESLFPIPTPNGPLLPVPTPNETPSPILTPPNGPLLPVPTPNGTLSPILTPPNEPMLPVPAPSGIPSPILTPPNGPVLPVPTPNGIPSPILTPPNGPLLPVPTPNETPPNEPMLPVPAPSGIPSPILTPPNGPVLPVPTPNGIPSPILTPPNGPLLPVPTPNGTPSPILTPSNEPVFPVPTPNGTPFPILTPPNEPVFPVPAPNGTPSPILTPPNELVFPVPTPNGTPSPILTPPNEPLFPVPTPNGNPPPILTPPNGPLFPVPTPNTTPSPTLTPKGAPFPILTPNGPLSPTLTPDGAPSLILTPNGPLSPTLTPNRPLSPTLTPKGAPSQIPTPNEPTSPILAPNGAPFPILTPNGPLPPTLTPNGAPFPVLTPNRPLSPTLTPKGAPSSVPTPNRPPSPTLTPNMPPSRAQTPNEAPSPTPIFLPNPSPKPSPKPLPNVDPQQKKSENPPVLPPENKNNHRKLLIISIVSSTVAALAIIALFLVCCLRRRKRRNEPTEARREEKPLATDSLQKSKKVGSTKDIIRDLSIKDASVPGDQVSGVGSSSLPLPPGKAAPPPPQQPQQQPPQPPQPQEPPQPPQAPLARPNPKAPPPPPPRKAAQIPNPPKKKPHPRATNVHDQGRSRDENNQGGDSESQKAKLKPFFWDKVNASPNRAMVWHEIKQGSFQFNEEMMENLFGYGPTGQNKNERGKDSPNLQSQSKLVQIIDPKKAQNLAILLKALNVTTEEVSDALKEGNELPVELISTLLKMAPTPEEELKLRVYNGDLALLGPSERFLKALVEIPFAFKRFEALLFMSSLQEESSSVKESFSTLEVACKTLRNSRLFLKLLEAVLKTGNRMNDGTYRGGADAFKLDTLLKLSDVRGTDGKTTLLSFVVQEIIRSEGIKAARKAREGRGSFDDVLKHPNQEKQEYYRILGLEIVSKLSEEHEDVKKAALIDGDTLTSTVLKLGNMLRKTKDFLNNEMKNVEEDAEFRVNVTGFVDRAEAEIEWLAEEENRIMGLVKSTGDYFHGKSKKDEGLHLFVIVRDFLVLLDNVCNGIRKMTLMQAKNNKKNGTSSTTEASSERNACQDEIFPSSKDGESDYSSSDDESVSP